MSDAQTLLGHRVRVRPWHRRDTLAQELWPRYTDPFNSLWNIPRSISANDDSLWQRSGGQRHVWAVEDRSRHLIGRISLREIDEREGRSRLGISLSAVYVGQKLGTEALSLFLDYYFGPFGFDVMLLDVAAFNQRAVRSYERLGFRCVGDDWRSAGKDPSIRLLDDPYYRDFSPYFQRGRFETIVQFYEMELHRSEWLGQQDQQWR